MAHRLHCGIYIAAFTIIVLTIKVKFELSVSIHLSSASKWISAAFFALSGPSDRVIFERGL